MNNNILEIPEEVSEFVFEICQAAKVDKEDSKLEENLTSFVSWVEDTLNNATLLSLIYRGMIDVNYNQEDGFHYFLNEEFRDQHLDVFPRDDNPIWKEIGEISQKYTFE